MDGVKSIAKKTFSKKRDELEDTCHCIFTKINLEFSASAASESSIFKRDSKTKITFR